MKLRQERLVLEQVGERLPMDRHLAEKVSANKKVADRGAVVASSEDGQQHPGRRDHRPGRPRRGTPLVRGLPGVGPTEPLDGRPTHYVYARPGQKQTDLVT